ncbi:hypothetical protein SEVIR_6G256001v4 [Setaria viridis]
MDIPFFGHKASKGHRAMIRSWLHLVTGTSFSALLPRRSTSRFKLPPRSHRSSVAPRRHIPRWLTAATPAPGRVGAAVLSDAAARRPWCTAYRFGGLSAPLAADVCGRSSCNRSPPRGRRRRKAGRKPKAAARGPGEGAANGWPSAIWRRQRLLPGRRNVGSHRSSTGGVSTACPSVMWWRIAGCQQDASGVVVFGTWLGNARGRAVRRALHPLVGLAAAASFVFAIGPLPRRLVQRPAVARRRHPPQATVPSWSIPRHAMLADIRGPRGYGPRLHGLSTALGVEDGANAPRDGPLAEVRFRSNAPTSPPPGAVLPARASSSAPEADPAQLRRHHAQGLQRKVSGTCARGSRTVALPLLQGHQLRPRTSATATPTRQLVKTVRGRPWSCHPRSCCLLAMLSLTELTTR